MKKVLTTLIFILAIVFCTQVAQAAAHICTVNVNNDYQEMEEDDDGNLVPNGIAANSDSFRGVVQTINNHAFSNCWTNHDDTVNPNIPIYLPEYFIGECGTTPINDCQQTIQQLMAFKTSAFGGTVQHITLQNNLAINSGSTLIIGNRSQEAITDPSSQLGQITGFSSTSDNCLIKDENDECVGLSRVAYLANRPDDYGASLGLTFFGVSPNYIGLQYLGVDGMVNLTEGELEIINGLWGGWTGDYKDWDGDGDRELRDYKKVILDISSEEATITCTGEPTFLSNMIVLVDDSDNFANNGCLNGGNLHVCNVDPDAEFPNVFNPDDLPLDQINPSDEIGYTIFNGNIISIRPQSWLSSWCRGEAPVIDLPDECTEIDWYPDNDDDGYGDPAGPVVHACPGENPSGTVDNGDDCNDNSNQANPGFSIEISCIDNIDNDCDGLPDCFDTDCSGDPICHIPPEDDCTNGIDDDGDGYIDCTDLDCSLTPECNPDPELCSDGIDNDGDGSVDCEDSDCASDAACTDTETECSDGIDNDSDGLADCEDTDCDSAPNCGGPTETCDDAIDNDFDGLLNCEDVDCVSDPACANDDFDNDGFANEIDCEPENPLVNPGAFETCDDGIDNDCNGLADLDEDESICPNPDVGDLPPDGELAGGGDFMSMDCSCNLKANDAPTAHKLSLTMLAMLPFFSALILRTRARRKEVS